MLVQSTQSDHGKEHTAATGGQVPKCDTHADKMSQRKPGADRPRPRPKEFCHEDVARMKELQSIGLSLAKIGKLYGVSRYHAQMAIFAQPLNPSMRHCPKSPNEPR